MGEKEIGQRGADETSERGLSNEASNRTMKIPHFYPSIDEFPFICEKPPQTHHRRPSEEALFPKGNSDGCEDSEEEVSSMIAVVTV